MVFSYPKFLQANSFPRLFTPSSSKQKSIQNSLPSLWIDCVSCSHVSNFDFGQVNADWATGSSILWQITDETEVSLCIDHLAIYFGLRVNFSNPFETKVSIKEKLVIDICCKPINWFCLKWDYYTLCLYSFMIVSQLTFTFSKSAIETLEKSLKYVQS